MANFDKEKASNRLKELRDSKNWSQNMMAQKLADLIGNDNTGGKGIVLDGVNGKQTISQLERGARGITMDIAFAYADIFGVSLDFVLGRSDDWQPEYNEIKNITGLSDEAIEILKVFNSANSEKPCIKDSDTGYAGFYRIYGNYTLNTLNALLVNEFEFGILGIITYYFSEPEKSNCITHSEYCDDETKELLLKNIPIAYKNMTGTHYLPYSSLNDMNLVTLQTRLSKLKDVLHKESDTQ